MDASRADELEYLLGDLQGDVCILDMIIENAVVSQAWDIFGRKKIDGFTLFLLTDQQDTALRQAAHNVRRDMRELLKAYHGDDGLP